jgi:hypothetical protein
MLKLNLVLKNFISREFLNKWISVEVLLMFIRKFFQFLTYTGSVIVYMHLRVYRNDETNHVIEFIQYILMDYTCKSSTDFY